MKYRITFEDHGQDFLYWEIDSSCKVVDCQPFQAFVWVGCSVISPELLEAGDKVTFVPADGIVREIKYPIQSIKEVEKEVQS